MKLMSRSRSSLRFSLPTLPLLCALAISATRIVAAQTLTAGDAWTRIHTFYTPAPPADTVDTLKAGDPSTPVTGIATTFLDSLEVLREAVRRGDNLIISHEPTFYNHRDETAQLSNDPVYQAKRAFIEQHHLVIYRLHDEIHADPKGDGILDGFYQALGWATYPHPTGPNGQYFVTIPPTSLEALAKMLQTKLGIRTPRVEGDPNLPVTHIAVLPGAGGFEKQAAALNHPETQVLIAGEAAEWDIGEYVRDSVAEGRPKAIILLGHEVTEEPGMERCASDLRVLFPGVRVDHILTGQPLWNPDHPPTGK